jgi:xanthosine phosphorylase
MGDNMKKSPYLACEKIKSLIGDFVPKIGIILGSGLGPLVEALTDTIAIPYPDIPGFPPCTIQGHGGTLYCGYLNKIPVAVLQGRSHFYEGYFHANPELSTKTMMTPIRTLKLLGATTLLVTNAAGSLHESVTPGNLVAISDQINFQFNNPLVGENDDEFGPRFVGMEDAYNIEIRKKIVETAAELTIPITEGVYFGVLGPMFETPAEIRAFRILGADVVGMSTISDVIVGRHCGMKIGVISVVTNLAAGMTAEILSHEITLRGAKLGVTRLQQLITALVGKL